MLHDTGVPCADGTDDHDLLVDHEDDDTIQGSCRDCGTALDADKRPEGVVVREAASRGH